MATNRDLLKEAIADAKSVKETAIANAKAALEEAFTPYLKEKLSAKLQEMEEEETKMEGMYEDETEEMMEENESMDEISLDELLAELEGEEMEESIFEAKEKEEEEEEEEEEEQEMSIEDMDEDDLKSFIEDVIKDMVSAGELEAGHEGMENEEGAEEMEMGDEEEEELDEMVDLDELLAELEDVEESSYTKSVSDSTPKSKNAIFHKGDDEYMTDSTEEDDEEYSADAAEKISFYEMELEEAYEAIKTLKSELNEINLLNAKLLYTNKIFRNKSLTESQKVKVLTAFDKATSKKEAQLVYETLLENLKTPIKKSPIQESLGSASKALGTAKSKPIIENDAFSRMRELAFGNNK